MSPEQRADAWDCVAELDAWADEASQSDSLRVRLTTGLLLDAAGYLRQLLDETEPATRVGMIQIDGLAL